MELLLTDAEVRVLGCLMEKEMATPDYYPLSLNGLLNACNQKSNRSPVVTYDEATTLAALDALKEQGLSWQSTAGRVTKYSENFIKSRNLLPKEAAVLCVLMLRGPQTAGEIRGRTERLYPFADLEEAAQTLEGLMEMDFVARLPRLPGCKEPRHTHLLAGQPEIKEEEMPPEGPLAANKESPVARIGVLEEELTTLRQEFVVLQKEFHDFMGQF